MGGKLSFLLNHLGLVVDWDCDTANVYDRSAFQHIVDGAVDEMVVFADDGFNKVNWFPSNMRLCKPGEWNDRKIVETVLSMVTVVCGFKKVMHRAWAYFKTRVGLTVALFNILVQWYGVDAQDDGLVPLFIAKFSL